MLELSKKNDTLVNGYKRNLGDESKKDLKTRETDFGFHYELKISGYVKDDFNFYLNNNNLIVTTDKSKNSNRDVQLNKSEKHFYCYPSAYFKKTIPLPKGFISNEITVNYSNGILAFDLFKTK